MNKTQKKNNTKYIFVFGGVVSSIGKGILASSLGAILKDNGYKVFMQKFDPYLNVDPGTMNPVQHGEVFVTRDGAETDLDLGHYERFLNQELNKNSNVTAGKIFSEILNNERDGKYLGLTIQYVPHVTNLIKSKIYEATNKGENFDFVITEIGGTIGDIELQPFMEAIKQFNFENPKSVCNILLVLLPYLDCTEEYKTKPAQNAVRQMNLAGIKPSILIARSKDNVEKRLLKKLHILSGVDNNKIINFTDTKFKYKCPLILSELGLEKQVYDLFKMKFKKSELSTWKELMKKYNSTNKSVRIAVVGKYVELLDSYISIYESLNFSGWNLGAEVIIEWIDSRSLKESNIKSKLKSIDGILVPGGFGTDGINGKIMAIKYARENNVPFLGICLGFQLAVIEYARNVLKIEDVDSAEFNKKCLNKIIDVIKGKDTDKNLGGTLRLGNYECRILNNTLAKNIYMKNTTLERHRHRYEFNDKYLKLFNKNGIFSGQDTKTKLKEIFEINTNDFFIATQFHPEFKSRPNNPHPLFYNFVKSSLKK